MKFPLKHKTLLAFLLLFTTINLSAQPDKKTDESFIIENYYKVKWGYAEVPGIGHDEFGLYNTKLLPTDSSSIAETL